MIIFLACLLNTYKEIVASSNIKLKKDYIYASISLRNKQGSSKVN